MPGIASDYWTLIMESDKDPTHQVPTHTHTQRCVSSLLGNFGFDCIQIQPNLTVV